jgi:hypothetical protein
MAKPKLTKVQQMVAEAEAKVSNENREAKLAVLIDIQRQIATAEGTLAKLNARKSSIVADLEATEGE